MKWILILAAVFTLNAGAQTNLEFLPIDVRPSDTLSNYNQITLIVTNTIPDDPYTLQISRRLTLGFVDYVTFSSPSNSATIVRLTTNGIPIRFYRVKGGADPGQFGANGNQYDRADIVCAQCDEEDQRGHDVGGNPFFFPFFRLNAWRYDISDDVLNTIMPPPLQPRNRQ